jgi:hypothetical protein
MKYIFSIIFIGLITLVGNSQVSVNFSGTDTVVNTGTKNLLLPVSGAYNSGAYQIIVTRLSGTAGGNALLQASLDNVNFVTLDTFAVANAALQSKVITETPVKFPYYRVSYTGTGTMSCIVSAKAHFKGKL